MHKKILVLGSSNVDLILKIPYFHEPGETVRGDNVVTVFGGKGANQAIAAKRLGGDVCFVTKLGCDHYGQAYRQYLVQNGLDGRYLFRDRKLPTGMALIELISKGENRIIVSPGANGSLSEKDLTRLTNVWEKVGVLVCQLEIPIPTVSLGLRMAKDHGAVTLLNPSPKTSFPRQMLSHVDFLVPNELEAQWLADRKIKTAKDLPDVARCLLDRGAKNVVITLGPKGLFFKNRDEEIRMKAFRVKPVDTTAAGDAFLGGLACGLSRGGQIHQALAFANGAGALATTKLGAQPSLPSRNDVIRFLSHLGSLSLSRLC